MSKYGRACDVRNYPSDCAWCCTLLYNTLGRAHDRSRISTSLTSGETLPTLVNKRWEFLGILPGLQAGAASAADNRFPSEARRGTVPRVPPWERGGFNQRAPSIKVLG